MALDQYGAVTNNKAQIRIRGPPKERTGLAPFIYSAACRFLAHLASTARRALSLRSSAVILEARTLPPSFPPRRPIFAKNSRTSGGSFFFAISASYVTPTRNARQPVDFRKGVTYN